MTADDGSQQDFDMFIANRVYPEASALFSHKLPSVDEIKDTCTVVMDTNALLAPYRVSPKSLDLIRSTYSQLVEARRLVIPGQVAREFIPHRAETLKEMHHDLAVKLSLIGQLPLQSSPLLKGLDEYRQLLEVEEREKPVSADHTKAIKGLMNRVKNWTWNDPVSSIYAELFAADIVEDPPFDRDEITADLAWRLAHKVPPGYADGGKKDSGIGDLLIWHTILLVGKQRKTSVLFVSGDEKGDWWYRSDGKPLYPRYELVDEFRRESDGQAFHMASFSRFLDIYGAGDDVVAEVRQEEIDHGRSAHERASALGALLRAARTANADQLATRLRTLVSQRAYNAAERSRIVAQITELEAMQPDLPEAERSPVKLAATLERLEVEYRAINQQIDAAKDFALSVLKENPRRPQHSIREGLDEVVCERSYPAGLAEIVLIQELEELAKSLRLGRRGRGQHDPPQ